MFKFVVLGCVVTEKITTLDYVDCMDFRFQVADMLQNM